MNYIKHIISKLQARIIHLGLVIALLLLALYLFCDKFRLFLTNQNIDPNFIIGFFTIIALFLSLIQNSKDKRYSYNLRLIDSIEDKGIKVIGKLLGINAKSITSLSSAQHCIRALKENKVFKDLNNSLSKENVENEMELIAAYIDSYFPEQGVKWNSLLNKLTQISNITGDILSNYNGNLELIQKNISFSNPSLDRADSSLKEAEKIDREIKELTLSIRDEIVTKMNDSKSKLKNALDFKF